MPLPEYVFLSWVSALSCMHLATIFPSVWRISPLVNMCLCPEPASLGHVRHDSELLLQPWGIPLSMTSAPTLSFYFTKKKWKRGERKSSRLTKVKLIDFKDLWAVRKLRNYLYTSTPELYKQTRSKRVRHTFYQIGNTLNIPDISTGYFLNYLYEYH